MEIAAGCGQRQDENLLPLAARSPPRLELTQKMPSRVQFPAIDEDCGSHPPDLETPEDWLPAQSFPPIVPGNRKTR